MYYLIPRKCATFSKLEGIKARIKDAFLEAWSEAAVKGGVKAVPPLGVYAGGIDSIGFRFPSPAPPGWKVLSTYDEDCDYYAAPPPSIAKIYDEKLPVVHDDEVNEAVGFRGHFNGGRLYLKVKVEFGQKHHLLIVPDGAKYNPPKGVKIINTRQYNYYRAQQKIDNAREGSD